MLGRLLKKNSSTELINYPKTLSKEVIKEAAKEHDATNNGHSHERKNFLGVSSHQLPQQYKYQRPDFLTGYSESDFVRFASHSNRPVVEPKSESCLPKGVGYAEVMNAGKSKLNEDQASFIYDELTRNPDEKPIKYFYFGLFDGHGGPGVAIKCAKELHHIIHEGLDDVLPYLVDECNYPIDSVFGNEASDSEVSSIITKDTEDETKEVRMSADELIKGALESAFWAMDRLILRDKQNYRISGGSCVLVALVIFDRLYVANAGDSRAILFLPKEEDPLEMSFDFTPESDRQRIQLVAYQRPELLRHPVTKEKLYNRHILSRSVNQADIGKTIMYRDFYMTGWSARDCTQDDVRLEPIISGRGKLCRLMATMGVARGVGDHGLIVKSSCVNCKEFLSCQPDIKTYELSELAGGGNEYLIMGTDGLWDVVSNSQCHDIVHSHLTGKGKNGFMSKTHLVQHHQHQELAAKIAKAARGDKCQGSYWEKEDGDLASGDDITVCVITLSKIQAALKR